MNKILHSVMRLAAIFVILISLAGCIPGSDAGAAHKPGRTSSQQNGGDLLDVVTPQNMPSQTKDYEGFRVSFNADNRTANWVAWELLASETDGAVPRAKKFWYDPDIKNCPDTRDYTNSGFDRGHLCPAADNKSSQKMMDDCFVMANICPQAHSLNAGAWKTLEEKERLWALRDGKIYIVAGPIYTSGDNIRIGEAQVRVPSAYFKVMIAPYISSPRGIAFIYPNMRAPGNMQDYSLSIDEAERITGLDFFHNLPDDLENEIEATASFKEWNRK